MGHCTVCTAWHIRVLLFWPAMNINKKRKEHGKKLPGYQMTTDVVCAQRDLFAARSGGIGGVKAGECDAPSRYSRVRT